jgi:protein-S-isoprenylcysteine O-methyltransferase Ste14
VLVWNVCHLALLALAVADVVQGALWLGGWPGLALVWTGACLRVWAYAELRQWYAVRIVLRSDQPLVTSGPIRHPLHMGLVLEMAGFFAMHASWPKGLLLVIAAATLIARNLQEDRALAAHFGGAFTAWRAWDVVDLLPRRAERGMS